jgi:hypothetical protein
VSISSILLESQWYSRVGYCTEVCLWKKRRKPHILQSGSWRDYFNNNRSVCYALLFIDSGEYNPNLDCMCHRFGWFLLCNTSRTDNSTARNSTTVRYNTSESATYPEQIITISSHLHLRTAHNRIGPLRLPHPLVMLVPIFGLYLCLRSKKLSRWFSSLTKEWPLSPSFSSSSSLLES